MPDKKSRLITSQDAILTVLRDVLPEDCVMTGGTALTRFYGLGHRFSEDIDLFSFDCCEDKVLSWLSALERAGAKTDVIAMETSATGEDSSKVFHAIAVVTPHGGVPIRVDFVEDVFSGCWLPVQMKTVDSGVSFRVDSIEAILHKKLYAIYSNTMKSEPPRGKDAVDVFMLFKNFFDLNDVRDFYRDGRDIVLPFESVIKELAHREFDLSGIIDLDKNVETEFLTWQEELRSEPIASMQP